MGRILRASKFQRLVTVIVFKFYGWQYGRRMIISPLYIFLNNWDRIYGGCRRDSSLCESVRGWVGARASALS